MLQLPLTAHAPHRQPSAASILPSVLRLRERDGTGRGPRVGNATYPVNNPPA
jgi:hypothetical protein